MLSPTQIRPLFNQENTSLFYPQVQRSSMIDFSLYSAEFSTIQGGQTIQFKATPIDIFTGRPFLQIIKEAMRTYTIALVLNSGGKSPFAYFFDANKLEGYLLRNQFHNPHTGEQINEIHYYTNSIKERLNFAHLYRRSIKSLTQPDFINIYLSAMQDTPEALCHLAFFYFEGIVVKQDISRAHELQQRAAQAAYRNAQFRLANLYYQAALIEKNPSTVIDLYTGAAQGNHALAQYNLGCIYYEGIGIKQNIPMALHWFVQAGRWGHFFSQYNAAVIYYNGIGVEKNIPMTLKYLNEAARLGHLDSQFHLGLMWLKGDEVQQSIPVATHYLSLATASGHVEASACLEALKNGRDFIIPSTRMICAGRI
jgi:TPR repeat protein